MIGSRFERQRRRRVAVCAGVLATLVSTSAAAQDWEFDARAVGLGGVSGSGTLASDLIAHDRPYRSIVLPFGLLQVLSDVDVFDPQGSNFDPVRAVEHAASPIHFIVGRDDAAPDGPFAATLAAARYYASQALTGTNVLASGVDVGSVIAPTWGAIVTVSGSRGGEFQGIYVGAGPFFSARGSAAFDPDVVTLVGGSVTPSPGPVTLLTTSYDDQLAVALAGGYRARFALPGRPARESRDGVYVAVNYDYLIGLQYTADADSVRFGPASLDVVRVSANRGRGFAIDTGAGVVVGRWEVGAGVNGIANRITWTDATQRTIAFGNVLAGGGSGRAGLPVPHADVEVSLPVDVRANVAYADASWTAVGEIGHGIIGTVFHGGVERRVVAGLQARGGVAYSFGAWNPTGGIGLDLSSRFSIDAAAFGSSANFERRRRLGLAVSLRINRVARSLTY